MADPLSIASGSLAVITATKQTVSIIYKFIRDCKEARADLGQITGELSELNLILELIKDEDASSTKDCLPSALQSQVQSMLASCTNSVQQIEKTLAKCRGKPGPLLWGLAEKEKVAGLKIQLEAFKSGLSLALETINLFVAAPFTRNPFAFDMLKHTTEMVRDNTVEIKRDTSEILNEIYKLRNQLPPGLPSGPDRVRLDQWLDNLTQYAETVVADQASDGMSDRVSDGMTDEMTDTDSILECAEEQGESDNTPDTSKQPHLPTAGQKFESTFTNEGSSKSASNLQGLFRKLFRENNEPAQSSIKTVVSSRPCNSNVIKFDYCETIKTWATMHKDLVLRFWSPRTGNLRTSLPVLRDDNDQPYSHMRGVKLPCSTTRIRFCDAQPDLIVIDADTWIELWDWGSGVRVPIARDLLYKERKSWTRFIPHSTILYSRTNSELILVDAVAPLNAQTIPFSAIMKGPYDSLRSRGYIVSSARFISENEIFILWSRKIASHDSSSRVEKSPQEPRTWEAYLVDLTSMDTSKSTLRVDAKYSDTVVKNSKVTARYAIPGDFTCIKHVSWDDTSRMLAVVGTVASHQEDLKKDGRGESIPGDFTRIKQVFWGGTNRMSAVAGSGGSRKAFILNLDTSVTLYQFDTRWCEMVPSHKYFITDCPAKKIVIARSLEDGHELGRIPNKWKWMPPASGTVPLMRQRNGDMEFSSWTVIPDELRTPRRTQ
ncbi:hypothetical protein NPX13_g3598 [Xylaria arbuscula]|uniref:Azaphilone pigments biosynthesis cluster protein L N-terminal domain-containing protein n=1 Tax=Xylaria arbuscula TaxID=114810 RepID=A0A9W8NI56_9PEZI|nr:hypothetical protein NPX13_g3598 [Xylaria arbuscula]